MKIGEILEFRKDLYFEGAVQADWFYDKEKSAKVAENFIFHGKNYFSAGADSFGKKKRIDTISFLEKLVEKFADDGSNPLTLAIADYGTGKSHLAVTLGVFFSGSRYMPETYNKVLKSIKNIDKDAEKRISNKNIGKNLVLVLNGMHDFNLNAAILKAAQRSLILYGLPTECLKTLNRSIKTAFLFFDNNKENKIEDFEQEAKHIGWSETGKRLIVRLGKELIGGKDAFTIVNNVYRKVNGQEIQWDEGISASAVLNTLIDNFCGLAGDFEHVVILFDEFGRYLEYASSVSAGESGDSALQQIFETTQNADGKLQVVNFIQSDIKAYLQRVDQTKNVSRYIGRYDGSEKYYLSSNLETVFANLIQRKDLEAFQENVVLWQKGNENAWKNIFNLINKWLPTKGIWQDYGKFRDVIIEGIYPLHPLATFMLTNLSDYLQNRSSLTLISQSISKVANVNIDIHNGFVILPEQMLRGDLYIELLAAEQEGRQPSQQCINYDNLLRKYNGKLSDNDLIVLRSNLILRILRFKTTDYDDAKEAIKLCSGLTNEEIDEALRNLEHGYAILEFDDHAGCFEFKVDSHGFYNFKSILKRKLAEIKDAGLYKKLFNDMKIRELADMFEDQATNFAIEKRISTNEWSFKQEIYPIEDFTKTIADELLKRWESAISPTTPKGTLVWLYINKNTSNKSLDKVIKIAERFQNRPILLMLVNDADNKLSEDLNRYYVLSSLDQEIKTQYQKYYDEEFNQVTIAIQEQFIYLKKQRQTIAYEGVSSYEKRMTIVLTKIFSDIYPHVIPFCYDGFITKNKNISIKTETAVCTIINTILSNSATANTGLFDYIHNLPNELRIRIEALFTMKPIGSWKCINDDSYHVIPPEQRDVRYIYNLMLKKFTKDKSIPVKDVFSTLTMPPFGLSEEIIALLVAVFCSNMNYCLRCKVNEEIFSIANWRDQIITNNGKKINFGLLKCTSFIWVDNDEISGRFHSLFVRIQGNRNLARVPELQAELAMELKMNTIPDDLSTDLQLVEGILNNGRRGQEAFNSKMEKVEEQYDLALTHNDLYNIQESMLLLHKIVLDSKNIFAINGYDFDDNYQDIIKKRFDELGKVLSANSPKLILEMHCSDVTHIQTFKNHLRKIEDRYKELGFNKFALLTREQCDKEISNIEIIKARQNLKEDCYKFLDEQLDDFTTYIKIKEMLKRGKVLYNTFQGNRNVLGKEASSIGEKLKDRLVSLEAREKELNSSMNEIWDDLDKIKSVGEVRNMVERINIILQTGIGDNNKADYVPLKDGLETLLMDIDGLDDCLGDRNEFKNRSDVLLSKYQNTDLESDYIQSYEEINTRVIENFIESNINVMDEKDQNWEQKYLQIDLDDRNLILKWNEDTKILPVYLKEKTIKEFNKLKAEVDIKLSSFKIEDIVYYFKKLNNSEQISCLKTLTECLNMERESK